MRSNGPNIVIFKFCQFVVIAVYIFTLAFYPESSVLHHACIEHTMYCSRVVMLQTFNDVSCTLVHLSLINDC